MPREHGAYAEVAFPLLTAFLLGEFSASGGLLAASVVAAFLLHEPVLVLLGRRGVRAREAFGRRASTRAALLTAAVVLSGVAGVAGATADVRVAATGLVLVAGLVGWLVRVKREKSMLGEGVVAVALSFASVPVALASAVPLRGALTAALLWAMVFLVGTATVHAMIARGKCDRKRYARIVAGTTLLWFGGVLLMLRLGGRGWFLGLLPAALVSLGVLGCRLSPRHLRVAGVLMVLADVVTVGILIGTRPTAGVERAGP